MISWREVYVSFFNEKRERKLERKKKTNKKKLNMRKTLKGKYAVCV